MDKREIIAKNVAMLLGDGDVVNLGIGIPTLVASFIPPDKQVFLHSENGAIGCDKSFGYPWSRTNLTEAAEQKKAYSGDNSDWRGVHKDLCDAGNNAISLIPGASCFDSTLSFAIARGGRLDATVLGAFQVDHGCNLANWRIPGKRINGMGGAMDIVTGAKKVIVAMEHLNRYGEQKIVEKCSLPLTAIARVNMIVTELCIIDCMPGYFKVVAIAPGIGEDEIIRKTGVELVFADNAKKMVS